ncbi:MAG TPA: rod shape-determining protein MreC [Terriglobales bacterium]|nr:rod shape-determining protein MreC [Terriglobales bacterium]
MLDFFRRNRVLVASAGLLLLSLLLSVGARGGRRDPVAGVVLELMRPLQLAVTGAVDAATGLWRSYIALVGVTRENELLRRRIRELEQQLVHGAEMQLAEQRLDQLLRFRSTFAGDSIAAQIIGRDPLPWSRTVTINKGANDGIGKNAAVLSNQGVVGQTIANSSNAARVLLITDHNSGVDAIIQRSRAHGIVKGALDGGCVMKYLDREASVETGDLVVTSGLDGIFPKGIVIGEVTEVNPGTRGLLKEAEIRPSAPLAQLEEVLIVTRPAVEEMQ